MKKYKIEVNYTPDHIYIDPDVELALLLPDDLVTKLVQTQDVIQSLPDFVTYLGVKYWAPGVYLDHVLWEETELEYMFHIYSGYFEVFRNQGITYTVMDKNGVDMEFQLYIGK